MLCCQQKRPSNREGGAMLTARRSACFVSIVTLRLHLTQGKAVSTDNVDLHKLVAH